MDCSRGLHAALGRQDPEFKARTEKNFVAIYLSGVEDGEPSHLMGIPPAPGGTGREEFSVLKETLESRMVGPEQVVGLVFDTTLTNTGEWEGVCSLLADYFGLPILWCGCRKHICGKICSY